MTMEKREEEPVQDVDNEYPSSWKFVFIMFSLGVSVLCMALVGIHGIRGALHELD